VNLKKLKNKGKGTKPKTYMTHQKWSGL